MKRGRQALSILLVCAMLTGALPIAARASGAGEGGGRPELLSLTVMDRNGETVSLTEKASTVLLGESYTFSVTFSHAEAIRAVYVTSTVASRKEYLEAVWDGTAFRTQGPFADDPDYIPGKIGVEYTTYPDGVDMDAGLDLTDAEQALADVTAATVTSAAGDGAAATVDLSKLFADETQAAVGVAFDVFEAAAGSTLLSDWLGIHKNLETMKSYAVGGSNYYLYLDYSDPAVYAMILRDISGNKYFKLICTRMDGAYESLPSLADSLSAVNTVSSLTYSMLNISAGGDELRREIDGRGDLSEDEKARLRSDVDAYEQDRALFTLTMAVIPAVTAATAGTMTAPAIVMGALLSVLQGAAGTFWDYRVGMIRDTEEPRNTEFVHGIPLTKSLLTKGELTQGGTYCLVENSPSRFTMGSINVELCLHGHICHITNSGGDLTLRDCTYHSGESTAGRLYERVSSTGGTVTVEDCCNVSLTMGGGCVRVYGGVLDSVDCTESDVALRDVTVTRKAESNCATLTMENVKAAQLINTDGSADISGGVIGQGEQNPGIVNDGGSITIAYATVLGYEDLREDGNLPSDYPAIQNKAGTVNVTNCTLLSLGTYAAVENSGTMTIAASEVIGRSSKGDRLCVKNMGFGVLTIESGRFVGTVENNNYLSSGGITINGGVFQASGRNNLENWTAKGTVTVNAGTFRAYGGSNVYTTTGNTNYLPKTVINGGYFYAEGKGCVSNNGISVSGGLYLPETDIFGGTFMSRNADTVYNTGIMRIHDGFFCASYGNESSYYDSGCVRNGARATAYGQLDIFGGVFRNEGGAYCLYTPDKDGLVLHNGLFWSSADGIHGGTCRMEIGPDSDITVYADYGTEHSWHKVLDTGSLLYETPAALDLAWADGYSGGIRYYRDASAGKWTLISSTRTDAIDTSGQFLRLTGTNVGEDTVEAELPEVVPGQGGTGGVTGTLGSYGELEWAYEGGAVTVSGQIGTGCAVMVAAYNASGRLLRAAAVRGLGGNVSIPAGAETVRLFWLSADYAPLCGRAEFAV